MHQDCCNRGAEDVQDRTPQGEGPWSGQSGSAVLGALTGSHRSWKKQGRIPLNLWRVLSQHLDVRKLVPELCENKFFVILSQANGNLHDSLRELIPLPSPTSRI